MAAWDCKKGEATAQQALPPAPPSPQPPLPPPLRSTDSRQRWEPRRHWAACASHLRVTNIARRGGRRGNVWLAASKVGPCSQGSQQTSPLRQRQRRQRRAQRTEACGQLQAAGRCAQRGGTQPAIHRPCTRRNKHGPIKCGKTVTPDKDSSSTYPTTHVPSASCRVGTNTTIMQSPANFSTSPPYSSSKSMTW